MHRTGVGDGRVVVTGANRGIGYHVLAALAEGGYLVAGLDIEGERIRTLRGAHPERVRSVECDVSADGDVEAAVEAVLDEWGRIDVLVNNAAVLNFGFFDEQTLEETKRTFEVNYFGYVRAVRAVLPHMRARGEGIVHNVSSGVGRVGSPGLTGYASTKAAVEAFTRSLRLELRREDVSCTIMHPRLASARSALEVFPASAPGMRDPAYVGRTLAGEIESTRPVIATDWTTQVGPALSEAFPSLVERSTERFLVEREARERGGNVTPNGPARSRSGN